MDIRDQFAAFAMQAIINSEAFLETSNAISTIQDKELQETISQLAYVQADAMIIERNKIMEKKEIPEIPGFPIESWTLSSKNLPETNGVYLCIIETTDELFGIDKSAHCCYFNHNTQKFYWDSLNTNVTKWTKIPSYN